MAKDFYKTLGVKRDASQADIQKAYRDLARKYHPDMNPDDPKASKKFQELQDAFDVLNTPEKRQMYDQYGTVIPPGAQAGPGGPQGSPFGGAWSAAGHPGGVNMEDVDFSQVFGGNFGGAGNGPQGGLGDIFEQIRRATGQRGRTASAREKRRGADLESEVTVPFQTAATGGQVQISLQRTPAEAASGEPETLLVKIPPGIEDGKKIRLRGQGEPARGNRAAGDLLLTVHVAVHPYFTRKGNDLYVRLPITLGEAVSGGSVDVPAPGGTVAVQIPAGTSSGKKLRVKGQGIAAKGSPPGDLFVEVQIMLPPKLDEADREAIQEIDRRNPIQPRHNLRW